MALSAKGPLPQMPNAVTHMIKMATTAAGPVAVRFTRRFFRKLIHAPCRDMKNKSVALVCLKTSWIKGAAHILGDP